MSENLRLSVSKTKTFSQCKKQYYFNYILKLPKKTRDYHIVGTFCHQVLENFHKAYIDGCLSLYNITMTYCFKSAYIEYRDKMTPAMKKECWEMLNQYLAKISVDKLNNKGANVIEVEKKFTFNIAENIFLTGMIDRIQIDDDNIIHIADYKTTKNKKYLANDYFQLLTYAFALITEDPTIEKIRGSYILLRHDFEYITTEFSKEEILKTKDIFLKYAEDINAEKEYKPNPTKLCGWCDYLDFCELGKAKVNQFKPSLVYGEVAW